MKILPFITFYLITEQLSVSITEFSSPIFDSCHAKFHSCENPLNNSGCSCDFLCKYYDDCCFDADGLSEERTEVAKLQIPLIEETTCEYTTFKDIPPSLHGVFMVSSCPGSWKSQKDVKNECGQATEQTDFLDLIPVFDTGTNVTFKNRQCALCHGVHTWVPWLLKFRCGIEFNRNYFPSTLLSFKDEMKLKMNRKTCAYRFEPSNAIKARYCHQKLEYLPWKVLKDENSTACKNRALAPFWITREERFLMNHFRNYQCFIDEFNLTNLNNKIRCLRSIEKLYSDDPRTISSLIDISTLLLSHGSTLQCSETEILLSEKIGCRPLHCPTNMIPFGGRCTTVTYKTSGVTLDLLFETNNVVQHTDIFKRMIERLVNELKTVFISQFIDRIGKIPGYNVTSGEPCSMIKVQYMLQKNPKRETTLEYQNIVVKNFISNYQHNFPNGVYIKHVDNVMESLCECNATLRNPSFVGNMFPHDTLLPCPAVEVYIHGNYSNDNNANSSELNGTIYLQSFYLSGKIIHSEDVLFKFGSYFLCVDKFKSKYQFLNENIVSMIYYRYIVNTICTCLSIISLFYSLIQYCGIPFMRQGKSELLFVLMLYLLFAQTGFLVISHSKVANDLCEWIGMLHHFVWVGSFTFMFLCSFRLNSEIRNLTNKDRSERFFETVKYCIVGFVLNISIVLCTKILNLLIAPSEIWYGGKNCFILNVYVLLLAFILPLSLCLCGNVLLFIFIIHYINATSMSSEKNSNISTMFALVKISSMMGFSWIIGIIATFVQSEILFIIFENISSLQGTFITLCFSCNNRVKTFYSGLFFKNKATTPSLSNTCSSKDP